MTPRIDFSWISGLADPLIKRWKEEQESEALAKYVQGALGGAPATAIAATDATSPATPAKPSFAGGSRRMTMPTAADPATEAKFINTLREGGLTNPYGLAGFAATGLREGGFDPRNFTRTWSDPSESGQPGTSGGGLSWRGDRLTKMLAATRGAPDPVVAQAKYAMVENPDLILALNKAKSEAEVNQLIADRWRYAGYNRPGTGEHAIREQLTRQYLPKVGGEVPQPQTGIAGLTPDRRAAILEGVRNPATRAAALAELAELRKPHPLTNVNGRLVDSRTGAVVADYSDTNKPPNEIQLYEYGRLNPDFAKKQLELKEKGATRVNVIETAEQRKELADQLGLKGDERTNYILEGKRTTSGAKETDDERKNRQLLHVTTQELPRVLTNYEELSKTANQAAARVTPEGMMGYTTSGKYQVALDGVTNIVASYLYSISGAAVNPDEARRQAGVLLPALGDKPERLAEKKARLQTMVEAIKLRANTKGGSDNDPGWSVRPR